MNTFNQYFKNMVNRKISCIGSDNALLDIAVKECKEGEENFFHFCECAKHLHEMWHFNPMFDPTTLVLADKTVLSKGMARNLALPIGAGMVQPTGIR